MRKYYSPLIGAALAAASLFQFSLPAFAAGTTAGTGLVNRATATYDDQNNNSYETTSNRVRVTVGKIAGITNVPINFTDLTSTPTNTTILPGDEVAFDFEITNTGNDVSDIFIPDTGNIKVENLVVDRVEYVTTDAQGAETIIVRGEAGFENGIIQDVDQNTSIVVRVIATVSSTATEEDKISLQLGDTGTSTADVNSADYPGTQNQADIGANNDVQAQDVRTQTADGPDVNVSGDPVNGQREASAKVIRTVGSESLALARLEKTNAGVENGADETVLTDNIITYNLNLEVAGNTDAQVAAYSDFPFNAEDLEGRDYTGQFDFTGAAAPPADETNLILVSDAIPENTTLDTASVAAPGANWTVVYTTDALTTAADDASWVATAPGDASTITRVGWVYDAETNGALAAGSNTTGFEFKVITTGITSNEATAVYNIAQVFGTTDDNNPGVTGLITYDESGDQNPANLNDDGTFGPDETATTDVNGNNLFGYADADVDDDGTEDNVDTRNDNSATGSVAGEVNKVIVAPVATISALFNGPDGNADAVGDIFGVNPADDNHDFQNLAAQSPGEGELTETDDNGDGFFISTYNPNSVTFTNAVSNPSQGTISNINLEPIAANTLNLGGDNTDLPDGTAVTITYDGQTARYTYTEAGGFTIDAANSDGTGTDGAVVIPNIARNSEVNYEVQIDLPEGTQLSTDFVDGNPANELIGAYPAVIAAYIDDGANAGLETDDTYNVTVNQVYTGYLQLVKKARVLRDDGSGAYREVPGMGFNDPDGNNKQPAPGDILEYQITYTNISENGGSGTGNGLLQADDVVITEDGTAGGNNWAVDNDNPDEDGDTLIDTLHPLSGAEDTSPNSVITYFDANGVGNTNPGAFSGELTNFEVTDDIVKYEVSGISRLEPGQSGVFTFQRKITSPEDIENLQ